MGDWLKEPPETPKSTDAQVPYVKRRRAMHTVSPPQVKIPNHGLKIRTYLSRLSHL